MMDQERKKIAVENDLTDELGVLISFLDPHLKAQSTARSDAEPAGKPAVWSWRKTITFVLITGLVGWSVILGVVYLLYALL